VKLEEQVDGMDTATHLVLLLHEHFLHPCYVGVGHLSSSIVLLLVLYVLLLRSSLRLLQPNYLFGGLVLQQRHLPQTVVVDSLHQAVLLRQLLKACIFFTRSFSSHF